VVGRFVVDVDAEHGGRWTSLRDPRGREWLWSRPDPARDRVEPGAAFVDVGGLEECYPTIGANPDHGDLWSRPWQEIERRVGRQRHRVTTAGGVTLEREIVADDTAVTVEYQLSAPAGTQFIWAAHALLELSVGTTIHAEPGAARAWPGHRGPVETSWPHPLGTDYGVLGPDDGSAMFCLLPARQLVKVRDGDASLQFRLECPGQPVSMGLWRNLGGYPWDAAKKYRNVGVEPMLGRVFDLDAARDEDAARVPTTGQVEWRLVIDNES